MILINRMFKLSNQFFLVCYMFLEYETIYLINNSHDYQFFVQFCLMAMKI